MIVASAFSMFVLVHAVKNTKSAFFPVFLYVHSVLSLVGFYKGSSSSRTLSAVFYLYSEQNLFFLKSNLKIWDQLMQGQNNMVIPNLFIMGDI